LYHYKLTIHGGENIIASHLKFCRLIAGTDSGINFARSHSI